MTRRDARTLDHATLEEMRRQAVKRVLSGETQVDVAASLEVNHHSVSKWMRRFRKRGAQALASTKAPGPAGKLSPRQQRWLERVIVGRNPRQLNFGAALWTLPLVADLIARRFGIVLHGSTVSRMLARLGITPQKPARRAFQRDEAECQHWMTVEFPKIVRYSKRRQSVLLFEDETGVQEDHALGRTWGRRGQTPVVETTGSRRRTNVISAISPRGRLWFRCYRGTLTAERFEDFLRALLHDIAGEIDLILDRHPAHRAARIARFLHTHRDRIRVHWLPAYAPQLNPDEHVWSFLKGQFRTNPLRRDEPIDDAVIDSMVQIRRNRELVRSFFGHPDVRYVKDALHW
mgnify:CR=1 FL=1